MMRMLLRVCFVSLLLVSGALRAETAADTLSATLGELKNLAATFEQTVRDDEGEILETSSGTLQFQRPHHMRWEVAAPYRYLILTNGQSLWRYDPDFEQLTEEPFSSVSQTPLMILAATADELASQYDISLVSGKETRQYVLKPRQKQSEFSRLVLTFTEGKLARMTLRDKLGQETSIALKNVTANQAPIAESRFIFTQEGAS
ncbi:outer membrane lipoprotein chaperone LolA [Litorivivens sp.]|uniref:outer membrane lipoprotein chaperone LolA n=1 Tax=Litorivivens sp. TaxID=2020868 RepID=UPI00356AA01E